jgi:hypothetical protein
MFLTCIFNSINKKVCEDFSSNQKWIAPAVNHVKANWNVAVDKDAMKMDIVVVVRAPRLHNIDPTTAEATATLRFCLKARTSIDGIRRRCTPDCEGFE